MIDLVCCTPAEAARLAPAACGAYRLFDGCRVIYVGLAAGRITLRYELQRHLRGDYGARTQRASAFDYRLGRDDEDAALLYRTLYACSGWRDPAHGSTLPYSPAPADRSYICS